MGLFKALYEIASVPLAVVKDVVTLGGVMTDEEPYTKQKMEDIEEAWDD